MDVQAEEVDARLGLVDGRRAQHAVVDHATASHTFSRQTLSPPAHARQAGNARNQREDLLWARSLSEYFEERHGLPERTSVGAWGPAARPPNSTR
jgi:hypothetical protein